MKKSWPHTVSHVAVLNTHNPLTARDVGEGMGPEPAQLRTVTE